MAQAIPFYWQKHEGGFGAALEARTPPQSPGGRNNRHRAFTARRPIEGVVQKSTWLDDNDSDFRSFEEVRDGTPLSPSVSTPLVREYTTPGCPVENHNRFFGDFFMNGRSRRSRIPEVPPSPTPVPSPSVDNQPVPPGESAQPQEPSTATGGDQPSAQADLESPNDDGANATSGQEASFSTGGGQWLAEQD